MSLLLRTFLLCYPDEQPPKLSSLDNCCLELFLCPAQNCDFYIQGQGKKIRLSKFLI